MKKILFILSFLYILSPAYELKLNSNITALKLDQQELYIGVRGILKRTCNYP